MKIINTWNYLADTKKLIGQSNAVDGELPPYCTTIEPPEIPEGKEAVFDDINDAWVIQDIKPRPSSGIIDVYGYMPDTLIYIGPSNALDSDIPPYCTTVAPTTDPAGGYVLTFDIQNQAWIESEDHIGETVYSTIDGSSVNITLPGPYPDNTTVLPPAVPFPVWNGTEWVTDADAQINSNVKKNIIAYRELMQSVILSLCPLDSAVAQNQELTTDQQNTRSTLQLFAVELAQFIQTADLTQSNLVFPEIEPALIAYPFVLNPDY